MNDFDRQLGNATAGARFAIIFEAEEQGMPRYLGNEKALYLSGFSPMKGQRLLNAFEDHLGSSRGLTVTRRSASVPGQVAALDTLEIVVDDPRMMGAVGDSDWNY